MNNRELLHSVITAWPEIRLDWSKADKTISAAMRKHSGDDAMHVANILYAMIRQLNLAKRYHEETGQPLKPELIANVAIAAENNDSPLAANPKLISWCRATEERLARDTEQLITYKFGMPQWLAKTLTATMGEEAIELSSALNERAAVDLRVNTLKASTPELRESLARIGYQTSSHDIDNALRIEGSAVGLNKTSLFEDGLFEIQDIGSQLIGAIAAPPPGATFVDYCAGLGGKTATVAQHMENRGHIHAADIRGNQLRSLRKRMRRLGISNVSTHDLSKGALDNKLSQTADVALVDAPCSGLGTLRRKPALRHAVAEPRLNVLADTQEQLCIDAMRLVKRGGLLIYATCTIGPVENDQVAERLAKRFKLVDIAEFLPGTQNFTDGPFLRLYPHRHGCDGFFAAAFRQSQ